MIDTLTPPIRIAHRGFAAAYPENTMAAFQGALSRGVEMIELDVTLSRDRRVVVIHDDTVDRTTDGTGRVWDLTVDDLKRLDAGGWFHPRFQGERIPLLREVLDAVGGRTCINIEIKSSAFEADAPPDGVERQVVEMVARMGLTAAVIISSFHPGILERAAALDGCPALGVLSETGIDAPLLDLAGRLGARSVNPDFRYLAPARVADAHRRNLMVMAYTVNQAAALPTLLEMGVDGIFTDDPELRLSAPG